MRRATRVYWLVVVSALLLAVGDLFAQAVPTAGSVKQSVDALTVAGPWVAFLLTAAFYADMRAREARCQTAIAALNARVDALQEKRVQDLENDSATLLAHAQSMGEVVSKFTAALDRLSDRVGGR